MAFAHIFPIDGIKPQSDDAVLSSRNPTTQFFSDAKLAKGWRITDSTNFGYREPAWRQAAACPGTVIREGDKAQRASRRTSEGELAGNADREQHQDSARRQSIGRPGPVPRPARTK